MSRLLWLRVVARALYRVQYRITVLRRKTIDDAGRLLVPLWIERDIERMLVHGFEWRAR